MRQLITIPMSHYCEKARWGLDWAGLEWTESAHLQVFHYRAVRQYDANGMVPVLVDGEEAVADSTNILLHLDKALPEARKLYPDDLREEIQQLEEGFDEELGIETRRWVYYHWMPLPSRDVLKIAGQGIPGWQRLMAPFMFPMMRRFLAKHLSISDDNVQTGMALVHKHFDAVAKRLIDGRAFICGDQFTAADLSFACMAAPVLLPREYGIRLPTPEEVPASARTDVDYFRAHPAGQYALKLFRENRQPTAA
jgi:glutathione S-transferase